MKKSSYTVPCSTRFRDAVNALAERQRVNAGDLARSVMLLLSDDIVASYPDPGDPAPDDRETVVLKSGPSAGKPWSRKPRLQVRLPEGFDPVSIRKALALALAMDRGDAAVRLEGAAFPRQEDEEKVRLKAALDVLAFEPLSEGILSRADALHVLGFPPGRSPDRETLRQRFRLLAAIHHPDSGMGDHRRMAQLNAAMEVLRDVAA